MTPIPVAWWLVVLVVGCLCLACYGLGGDHMKRAEDYRFAFVIQTNRHHATALRHLYDALELLMPEMEPEPQPGPTLRQRLAARARQAGAWVKARFRGRMEVEAEPVVVEGNANEWDEADYRRQADADMARLMERIDAGPSPFRPADTRDCTCNDVLGPHVHHVHVDTYEPDPAPVTQPDLPVQPGPATEPQGAIGTRVEDLALARLLADIEAQMREWEESHA